MKELLEQLKELIINKEYSKIKLMLEITDKYIKGKLFEEFLAMLFQGNGFIATIKGGAFDGGADRFCEGALLSFMKSGAIQRELVRLKELDL